MRKIIKFIPNGITLLNLLSGIFSVYFSMNGNLQWAAYAIFIASLFDFLDGFVARLLKATSEIGKELDSLSDVVSFGVAPGFIAYVLLENVGCSFSFIAFLIPLMAAYRLARFNVLQAMSSDFSGLPVPAVGIFFASLVFTKIPANISLYFIVFNIVALSVLMVSTIRLFSLKLKSFSLKSAFLQYILLVSAILLFLFWGEASFWMIIYIYLLINIFKKNR